VPLDQADAKYLGLDTAPATDSDSTAIIDNITLGQARMMTGDIGMESWQKRVARKTTIARNKFGSNLQIMTGDMGGQAAADFNKSFWS
jgi:hypothetical protein